MSESLLHHLRCEVKHRVERIKKTDETIRVDSARLRELHSFREHQVEELGFYELALAEREVAARQAAALPVSVPLPMVDEVRDALCSICGIRLDVYDSLNSTLCDRCKENAERADEVNGVVHVPSQDGTAEEVDGFK